MSCTECIQCGYCYEKAAAQQAKFEEEILKELDKPSLQDVNEEISVQYERDNPP